MCVVIPATFTGNLYMIVRNTVHSYNFLCYVKWSAACAVILYYITYVCYNSICVLVKANIIHAVLWNNYARFKRACI